MMQIDLLHVMAGYKCNLKCTHCVNDSGPNRVEQMSPDEIQTVCRDVAERAPKQLLFTGGEPTLYVPTINSIIESHPNKSEMSVTLTTNGWYSKSEVMIASTFSKFTKIDHIQLSFDAFHGSRLSSEDVKRLMIYCEKNNLGFNVSVCISSPLDLVAANNLQEEIGCPVIFQKVEASGRGKTQGTHFKYQTFDSTVLEKKCPNLGSLNYIANLGYTVCCSNLVFNQNQLRMAPYNTDLDSYLKSDFNQIINKLTFGQMIEKFDIGEDIISKDDPSLSSPCTLCEKIFCNKKAQ